MYVINRTRGTYLGVNIKVANSFRARLIGLYFNRHLHFGDGVWLIPTNSIQTIGLHTPIDLVFLDIRLRVVRLCERVRPGRVVWRVAGAHSTLEVPAGVIRSSETQVGDQVEIVDDLSPLDGEPAAVKMDGRGAPDGSLG